MVVCFSCGARLDANHACPGPVTPTPRGGDGDRAAGCENGADRPVLTLIRTLPTIPTLFDQSDPPPVSAA
ncbi:MAG: hypothetical protein U0R69_05715 [Gaiellales bacterium]